jgi:membrane protein insertase Oxa1/YidC/SpoIIIJ
MNNIVSPVYRMWNEVIKNREDIGMSIFSDLHSNKKNYVVFVPFQYLPLLTGTCYFTNIILEKQKRQHPLLAKIMKKRM